MADAMTCSECGGTMMAVDIAGHDNRPALVRSNFGTFFSKDSLVHLERAHACAECGYTKLFVDPAKLKQRATPRAGG